MGRHLCGSERGEMGAGQAGMTTRDAALGGDVLK